MIGDSGEGKENYLNGSRHLRVTYLFTRFILHMASKKIEL